MKPTRIGYTTDFTGQFRLDRRLAPEHAAYLRAFNEARHMRLNAKRAETVADHWRVAAGLPVGREGMYCTFMTAGASAARGLVLEDASPLGPNTSRYCGWVPTDDDRGIAWDGAASGGFAAWLAFVVEHFLDRWGYAVRGAVAWEGETAGDTGVLVVLNNRIVVAGSGHPHCTDGDVGDDMKFQGRFAHRLVSAACLGGVKAVVDLLSSPHASPAPDNRPAVTRR